ncbi:hypothetical protein F5Y14DRAFT_462430 [Nemania sp. NC0429]|nr:hypothetical protein F5Y14DRAFT_462430 [Nemania sp. NC0429]
MPSHSDRKTEGTPKFPNPRQKPKSLNPPAGSNSDDKPKLFKSFKGLFERKVGPYLPSPGSEPRSLYSQDDLHSFSDATSSSQGPSRGSLFSGPSLSRSGVSGPSVSGPSISGPGPSRPSLFSGPSLSRSGVLDPSLSGPSIPGPSRPSWDTEQNTEHNHRAEPEPSGTRGIFVPTYRAPEHFSQRHRRANPILSPLVTTVRLLPRNAGDTIVRFFDCKTLICSEETLKSPDANLLVSSAVAFLGELQPGDGPEASKNPNSGYRGLNLAASQGSYHLHYPDSSGVRPVHGAISTDWESVKKIHKRESPNEILFVGVGLGQPGAQCTRCG